MGCEDRSTIRNNQRGESVLAPDVISEQLGCCESVFLLGTWYKYSLLRESVNDHQNIVVSEGFQHLSKIDHNILPGTLGCWQRQQLSSRGFVCCFVFLATLTMLYILLYCHDRDRTYPYSPYSDLSMPIPSHLNHSQAPNAKPEPSDPLASQQRTPEHSDSLASSQRIPDPTLL